jgi:16S rRNA (cytidine1402-2'-O)-methyltransferase
MRRTAEHEDPGQAGKASLYVVATPIGNLRDVTLRALDVLRESDVVAAEDTRVTARLLQHFEIAGKKLIALHEHNEQQTVPRLLALLAQGRSVALVSDAGTPAFSDPGARCVTAVRAAGYPVVPIPGPSAAMAALSASGLAGPPVLLYGFLPARPGERRRMLEGLAEFPFLLLFYEAPHRVLETLEDLTASLGGERRCVIARELTKIYESVHACTLSSAAQWLREEPGRTKGEFVLIVEGAPPGRPRARADERRTLGVLLEALPTGQAAALTARITGARKEELYALALRLRKEGDLETRDGGSRRRP